MADEKMAAEREVLAIRLAVEEYTHAATLYDSQVRAFIMSAKEYAAEVEREQKALERSRAELAVAKEEMRLKEISAQIYQEYLNRAMVEADLARAKLDVLKAHTRVLEVLADTNAKRGLTIIAAMHHLKLASAYFPRLILMKEAAIVADGPPHRVLTSSTIGAAYSIAVQIQPHPMTGVPQVVVLPVANGHS